MTNIENDSNTDLVVLETQEPSARDQQVARLEGELSSEKDSRKQERFFFVFAIVIFLVYFGSDDMKSTVAMLFMYLLLVIFLIGYAAHCGVEKVAVPLQRLYDWLLQRKNGDGDEGT